METSRWEQAQENELAIWHRTVSDVADVLAEVAEAAALFSFGRNNGLASGSSVLELGIGPMGIGWAAFASASRAVGVDPLPQLNICTGNANVDQFVVDLQRRSEFIQADATLRLPLEDNSFDLVVCDNVVDHTQDPRAILAEARRLARQDGRLLFGVNVFSAVGILKWRQVTRRIRPQDPNVLCHPHSFLEGDVQKLLSSAGWEVIASDGHRRMKQRLAGHAFRVRAIARPV